MIAATLFGVLSSIATIWQILYGNEQFFGVGFFVGVLVFYIMAVLGLNYRTKKLPYYLLARQNILPAKEKGPLVTIAVRLDRRYERIKARQKKQLQEDSDHTQDRGIVS